MNFIIGFLFGAVVGYVVRKYYSPKQLKDAANKVAKDIKEDLK